MSEIDSRIEQFQKMAEADPANELGHFSLGRAYLDAGCYAEAVGPLSRVLELNPNFTKAHQLLATALLKLERRPEAIARLSQGVHIADQRGDLTPRNDMVRMLKELGAPVPQLKSAAAPSADRQAGPDEVTCVRCNRVAKKMPYPPFSNALGKEIHEKVCADCWREWIGMGTKVINELRLPLSDPQAQKIFDQHMIEFLNLR